MNVVIHPVHFDASAQLVDFINKKLKKLETFFDRIIEAEVFLLLNGLFLKMDKVNLPTYPKLQSSITEFINVNKKAKIQLLMLLN